MERTFANRRTGVADVQYRGEADIDILGNHFRGHQPAGFLSQTPAFLGIVERRKGLRRR
ncbi:hypothetical protein D3C76_1358980 [compost metagenome]